MHSLHLLKLKRGENVKWERKRCSRRGGEENGGSREKERVSDFSLEIHEIQPLDFDGARRENVLRKAGYAWTLELRVLTNSKR